MICSLGLVCMERVLHVLHVAGWAWQLLVGVSLLVGHTKLLVVVVARQLRRQAGTVCLNGYTLMWVERVLAQNTHDVSILLVTSCCRSQENFHLFLHIPQLLLLGVAGDKAHCIGRG